MRSSENKPAAGAKCLLPALAAHKAVVIVAGVALAGVLAGAVLTTHAIKAKLAKRADVLRFKTRFGTTRIYEVASDEGRSVRLLEVDGTVQSGTYVDDDPETTPGAGYADLVFEYLKKYDLVFAQNPNVQRVCVLGCGGYDYPKHLIAHHPQVTVDAVEIDPAITALAERYFYLDRLIEEYDTESTGRLNLIQNDALAHLLEEGPRYDAIVNDVFDGSTPPKHLITHAFYAAVRHRLNPGGLFLTNIVGALEGPNSRFLHDQIALMELVFSKVEAHPCDPDDLQTEDNVIVVAYA